jgi:hypothetical protein
MTYLEDYIRPVLEDSQLEVSNDNRRTLHLSEAVKRAIKDAVEKATPTADFENELLQQTYIVAITRFKARLYSELILEPKKG